jgi:hypothetical protein
MAGRSVAGRPVPADTPPPPILSLGDSRSDIAEVKAVSLKWGASQNRMLKAGRTAKNRLIRFRIILPPSLFPLRKVNMFSAFV